MTTVCDPGAGKFRAMEDESAADLARERKAEEIHRDLVGRGRWGAYDTLTDRLSERVIDEIGDKAPELLSAIYWLDSRNPERQEKAKLWLVELGKKFDAILYDEIEDEIDRQEAHFKKYGDY